MILINKTTNISKESDIDAFMKDRKAAIITEISKRTKEFVSLKLYLLNLQMA